MNPIETFYGWIDNTADAFRIFQLCRSSQLGRVRRRLQDSERRLIRSGSVFVFSETESGMKRWTDGKVWSPSRILGHFLIYRELEPCLTRRHSSDALMSNSAINPQNLHNFEKPRAAKAKYSAKTNGLVKKTMSVTIDGDVQHLICYYSQEEFIQQGMNDPKAMEMTEMLRRIPEPDDIILKHDFRKKPRSRSKSIMSRSQSAVVFKAASEPDLTHAENLPQFSFSDFPKPAEPDPLWDNMWCDLTEYHPNASL